jgi:hypothetical protein
MNFLHYITKSRKGKEAQRIEREAMKDPFLADAIEGYDLVTNEDPAKRIAHIRETIRRKTRKRVSLLRTAGIVAGIAASLLVLVGIGSLFMPRNVLFLEESSIAYSPDTASSFEDNAKMMCDESDWADDLWEEKASQSQEQWIDHSLTVPEPTPLRNNAIKGEPKPATGERAYKEYIYDNLFLPAFDECSDTKGQVVIAFKINAKGRPYDLDIKKSLCPTADQEAIRVVQQGPSWTLGDRIAIVTIRF